jgi:hypothetical protein
LAIGAAHCAEEVWRGASGDLTFNERDIGTRSNRFMGDAT